MMLRSDDRAEVPGSPGSRTRDLRAHLERPAVRWTLLGVAGLLLVNVVAALALFGLQRSHVDAVLAGVEVDGEPVGGLERPHLAEVVRSRADDRLAQPVRITTAGQPGTELETDRAAMGVTVDVERAADDAWQQGRRGLWRALADQVRVRLGATLSVPLHVEVDDDHLDDWSTRAADELSREPRPAAIELVPDAEADAGEASVEVTTAHDGLEVAPDAVAEQVRDHLTPLGPAHVEVPAEATTPEVTDADVDAIVDEAELAISAPVELANPSPADDVVLDPTDLATVLVVDADLDAPDGERLRITSDGQRLGDHLGDERVDELGPGAVEATLRLDDGAAVIEGGVDGFELDLDAAAQLVVELATQDDEPRAGELPGATTSPEITAEAAERALPDAEVLVSDHVVLTNPSAAPDLELSPADLAAVLQVELDAEAIAAADEAEDGDEDGSGSLVQVTTSGEALTDHLGEDRVAELETAPVELEVAAVDDELVVEGGTPGFAFDADAAAEVVVDLASQGSERTAELPGAVTQPDPSRDGLEEAGITEIVSSFTTSLVPGQARNTNIQRAADFIDGDIIEPGATYSLNQGIGQRTADSGFVENGFIRDGELISVTGGGVSQMGTTFMNAAWFAGIQIHEFHPHSLYFQRYPVGREATLSWGTLDVVVENDSPHSIMILTSHSESSVTVSFASTSWAEVDTWTGERTNIVEGEVRDGFDITFGRDITYPDGSTESESYSHRYEPEGAS